MKLIPSIILLTESILTFYYYFGNDNSYNSTTYLKLILGVIFLVLATLIYLKPRNRIIQWVTIVISLVWGPGSFLGLGGIFALILAIIYFLIHKK